MIIALGKINKNNVKNQQKTLKDRWCEVHDLFAGLSGFLWSESIRLFGTENEVWDDLIKVHYKPLFAIYNIQQYALSYFLCETLFLSASKTLYC